MKGASAFASRPQRQIRLRQPRPLDDGGPGGAASSQIAIIDRSEANGSRKVVGQFFSHVVSTTDCGPPGRHAHLHCPRAGRVAQYRQCRADGVLRFRLSDPAKPQFFTQIPLGDLSLPSCKPHARRVIIALAYCRLPLRCRDRFVGTQAQDGQPSIRGHLIAG